MSNEVTNEVEINSTNCFNMYFDDLGNISYTRKIDRKLYTYRTSEALDIGLVQELSALTNLNDDGFKLICKLQEAQI